MYNKNVSIFCGKKSHIVVFILKFYILEGGFYGNEKQR